MWIALLLFTTSLFATEKPLTVGMELSYPPFEMVDTEGRPTGISVDLAYALGEYLNRNVTIVNIPYVGLIPALKTGKIDLIISSLSVTPKREKAIDFSLPYLQTGLSLLVSHTSSIQQVEDLNQKGKKVIVKLGTTGHLYAEEHLKNGEIIVLDKESAAVMEITLGKADAFIYDQLSVYKHWKKHPATTRPLLSPFNKEPWAIGIRKGNRELKEKVNAFLVEFQKNKGFDTLSDTYLKDVKETFKERGLPFIFARDS